VNGSGVVELEVLTPASIVSKKVASEMIYDFGLFSSVPIGSQRGGRTISRDQVFTGDQETRRSQVWVRVIRRSGVIQATVALNHPYQPNCLLTS